MVSEGGEGNEAKAWPKPPGANTIRTGWKTREKLTVPKRIHGECIGRDKLSIAPGVKHELGVAREACPKGQHRKKKEIACNSEANLNQAQLRKHVAERPTQRTSGCRENAKIGDKDL